MGKLISFSNERGSNGAVADYAGHFGLTHEPFEVATSGSATGPKEFLVQLREVLDGPGLTFVTHNDESDLETVASVVKAHLDEDQALASFSALPTRPEQLLAAILHDFGFDSIDSDLSECRSVMEAFLLHNARMGTLPVVIIPDADQLDMIMLDELARLLRIEDSKRPCIHLFLQGSQAFLEEAQAHFADIDSSHIEMSVLKTTDVADYVFDKLQAAGSTGRSLFTPAAIRHIGEVSGGLPENIDRICAQALRYACENEDKKVSKRTLLESLAQIAGADEPQSVAATAESVLAAHEVKREVRGRFPYFELSREGKRIARFELKGGKLTIGRHKSNDIYIPSPGVSLFHTIIVAEDRDVFVFDLRSTNGTCLNGRDVRSKRLSKGDEIAFGSVELRFYPGDRKYSDIPSGENVLHFAETVVLEDSEASDPTAYIKTSL